MSYEYKDEIQDSIIQYYDNVLIYNEYTDDVLDELDHVYAQSAKADEYEAKAKAWDKLSMSIRECNKEIELKGGLNAMFRTSKKGQIVQRYIDCFESGESDELRE